MACVLPLFLFATEEADTMSPPQRQSIGSSVIIVAQCAVNLWIWSVWTWRFSMATSFRGRGSTSLLGEFDAYGYSLDTMKAVGLVKLSCATLLAVAMMLPEIPYLVYVSSGGLLVLMLVAIVSHIRVGDPWTRNIPAVCMALLSLLTLMGSAAGCVTEAPDSSAFDLPPVFGALAGEHGRLLVGVFILVCDFLMWYQAKNSGTYKQVPASPDNPFFALVEGK
ncbi:unnamed protein product [Amoebophrya sp. A25]|nr:unnamed protein product [Amoebophrya sp. A25]|eukprot:GSA25T00021597001.1